MKREEPEAGWGSGLATPWQMMEDSAPFCTRVAMHPKGMKEHHVQSKDFGICISMPLIIPVTWDTHSPSLSLQCAHLKSGSNVVLLA